MNLVKLILIGLAMTSLAACSRTVEWEEEVPLNTGETIIVKRTVPWELQGGAGNPLDIGMRPNVDQQVLQFTYKGKNYSYSGGAAVRWVVISKEGIPNLVATPSAWAWDRRNFYFCTVPFYVQFKPNASGEIWTWPNKIEPWLYGSVYNLMAAIPRLNEDRKGRYTAIDRKERDRTFAIQSPHGIQIDAEYEDAGCPRDPATMNIPKPTWNQK